MGTQQGTSDLTGRVALVTGAASGIGAATADLLASLGAAVYGADIRELGETHTGAPWTGLQLDVRDEEGWERVVGRVMEEQGRLDFLVHAAGISRAKPLPETSLTEWREVMAVNLDSSFLALKHGIRAMEKDGGAVVLLGSASGIRASSGAAAYSTSKAAVSMLARAAVKECRDRSLPIRINVLSPAGVKTSMWEGMAFFKNLVREHGSVEAAFAALEASGGGRFAEPGEVARTVLFLLSDAAGHINGVELAHDDGYTL